MDSFKHEKDRAYAGKASDQGLEKVLQRLLEHPEIVSEYRQRASQYVCNHYSWETVTDSYERLFYQLCKIEIPARLKRDTCS